MASAQPGDWFEKQTLGSLPERAAPRWGSREALCFKGRRLTFADLAGEEGASPTFDRFLRRGLHGLREGAAGRYPGLASWRGVGALKESLRSLAGARPALPVLLAGWHLGLLPALVAAVAGVLWSGYFFFSPYYSYYLARPPEILNLVLFMVVAVVTSHLANSMKRQTELARKRGVPEDSVEQMLQQITDPGQLADLVAGYLEV